MRHNFCASGRAIATFRAGLSAITLTIFVGGSRHPDRLSAIVRSVEDSQQWQQALSGYGWGFTVELKLNFSCTKVEPIV